MELLSSSMASTAAQVLAQARLLRAPSCCRPGPGAAGFVACRSYAVRSKLMMRAVPPIRASFQPAFLQQPNFQDANMKKRNVPCYQRQKAPQLEAKF